MIECCGVAGIMVYTEFKLFVGGLAWDTTADGLKVHMEAAPFHLCHLCLCLPLFFSVSHSVSLVHYDHLLISPSFIHAMVASPTVPLPVL